MCLSIYVYNHIFKGNQEFEKKQGNHSKEGLEEEKGREKYNYIFILKIVLMIKTMTILPPMQYNHNPWSNATLILPQP